MIFCIMVRTHGGCVRTFTLLPECDVGLPDLLDPCVGLAQPV